MTSKLDVNSVHFVYGIATTLNVLRSYLSFKDPPFLHVLQIGPVYLSVLMNMVSLREDFYATES